MTQYQLPRWDSYGPTPYFPSVVVPEPAAAPKVHPIGEVTDYIENEECFKVSSRVRYLFKCGENIDVCLIKTVVGWEKIILNFSIQHDITIEKHSM